jgi:hypothetical protein
LVSHHHKIDSIVLLNILGFLDTKEATPIQNPRDESRKRPFSPPLSNDQSFQAQAFLEQNTVTNGEKYGYASAVSLSQYHNSVGLSLPIDPLGYSSSAENQPISNSTLVESSSGNLLTLQQNRKVPHYSSINSRPTTGGDTGVDPTTCEPRFDYASQGIFCNMMVELPYEAPIFTSVQRGDVNWTRMLFTSSPWLINAVDPYGFGLFYVSTADVVALHRLIDGLVCFLLLLERLRERHGFSDG